jgi:hypothetical protein
MPGALRCFKVGDALVVHREDADVPQLQAFAARLASDPRCVVVVLGRGADRPGDEWEPVLPILAAEGRDVRLVPGTASLTSSVRLGQWLAARLGRAVLAHDGLMLQASGGALFVPPAQGAGWMWLRSGQEPSSGSRRFPSPGWSCAILEYDMLTELAVAEPLPAGAWVRPQAGAGADRYRQELVSRLAWSDDCVYVVLGCPGAPPVAAADVEAFWRLLPREVRAVARFVPYGDVAVPEGQPLSLALTEWLGEDVTVGTEVPWSTEEPPPSALHAGKGTLDLETSSPYPETGSLEPEMVAPAAMGRAPAGEVSPGPEEETDEPTVPLPVLRRRQSAVPAPAPAPPLPAMPSVTRLDAGPADEVPVPPHVHETAEGPRQNPSPQDPPRRKLHRMRWAAIAAAVCLAVAVPTAVLALSSSPGPTRNLAATGPVVAPASQTIAPSDASSPSATAASPHKTASKVERVPAVEDTAAAHASPPPGVNTGARVVSSGGGSGGDTSTQGASSGSNTSTPSWEQGNPGSQPPSEPAQAPSTPVETAPASTPTTPSSGSFAVSGEVSCVSGNSVEGVWVQADDGAGWAPWVGLGNGSTSTWSFTLPEEEAYSLHVGCGGTTASWAVADYSPAITTATSTFNCIDVSSDADYGACELR